MEKILKKYTTIPEHLYVNRGADDQLRKIVEEMERPGYVLVARQMGKTNLLFNAKRRLENPNRLFAYVDLSNVFALERDCYRNIIDNILEPNESIFKSIEEEVYEIRKQDLPANKEYSKSLRVILNHFCGDLIIILDEIDALRSATYSDHIFAQIRSNYFSRTNFPVFSRLTYILSGVIDPTELIKDRNKSPFNIGEKIYLNDFEYEEFILFIEKSTLNISEECINEIYTWTNGNPRLTFDICSEIENHILDNKVISQELISDIVKRKYLINYDLPPIDHIRELIKSNKFARDAVANIQKGKHDISDELKQKLYLYGIISSDFDEKTVIKNKIILESLSLKWINTLDDESKITVTYGLAQYENKEYSNAIDTLIKVLNDSSLSALDINTCNYILGNAYFKTGEYENAIRYLSFDFEDDIRKRNALSRMAVCKLNTNFEEAILLFEDIIKTETNNFAYHNALLNLAINLPTENSDRALVLFQQLYDSTFKSQNISEDELNKLRTLAFYYQAEIYSNSKNTDKALKKLQEAKKHASVSNSLYIIYTQYILRQEGKEHLKKDLIDAIIDNKILFDNSHSYPISFNENHLFNYISLVFDTEDTTLFTKILDYAESILFNKQKNKYEIIYEVTKSVPDKRSNILTYILENKSEINDHLYRNVLKNISFLVTDNHIKFFEYFNDYLKLFDTLIDIGEDDILLFAIAIKQYFKLKKIDNALQLCETIEIKIKTLDGQKLKTESLMIYYWYAVLYERKYNKELAVMYAEKTIKLINDAKNEAISIVDEQGLEYMSNSMNKTINMFIKRIPIVHDNKFGRNDKIKVRYTDGKIKECKFKQIKDDLEAGRCEICQ